MKLSKILDFNQGEYLITEIPSKKVWDMLLKKFPPEITPEKWPNYYYTYDNNCMEIHNGRTRTYSKISAYVADIRKGLLVLTASDIITSTISIKRNLT